MYFWEGILRRCIIYTQEARCMAPGQSFDVFCLKVLEGRATKYQLLFLADT